MKPISYSARLAKESGSNFYPAFRFLNLREREGLSAVYAFSRLVDDAVDLAAGPRQAEEEVDLWKERLLGCYNGSAASPHPLIPELKETIERFSIPKEYFLDLLKGVRMDLEKKRYATFRELEDYCYHVAGTVGLLCNRIFGRETERHRRYAVLLGTAFQLTNIIRDVRGDLERDRIYFPEEDLRRFSYREEDLRGRRETPSFFDFMRFQSARARGYYEEAKRILPTDERRGLSPAEVMRRFYEALLRKIENKNYPVFREKVRLSFAEKGRILLSSWVASKL